MSRTRTRSSSENVETMAGTATARRTRRAARRVAPTNDAPNALPGCGRSRSREFSRRPGLARAQANSQFF
eukprot:10970720-Heterocapsa_arctica.AAC.1